MISERVHVLIPTRDRPLDLIDAYRSVVGTSDACVSAYVDRDQERLYLDALDMPFVVARNPHPGTNHFEFSSIDPAMRLIVHIGDRHGPVAAINFMCHHLRNEGGLRHLTPRADIFVYMTDDSRVGPVAWDDWLTRQIDLMPGKIGVVSASHGGSRDDYLNFASMSAETVEALGWFAPPVLASWYWDTALELVGAASRLVSADPSEFRFEHAYRPRVDRFGSSDEDCRNFARWCALEFRSVVKRLRQRIPGVDQ